MALPMLAPLRVSLLSAGICAPRRLGAEWGIRHMTLSSTILPKPSLRSRVHSTAYDRNRGVRTVPRDFSLHREAGAFSAARFFSSIRSMTTSIEGRGLEQQADNTRPTQDAETASQTKESEDSGDRKGITKLAVAYHLFFCAALVYLIIVVGGLTRLTESGLSITEWNPGFKGMRMPWTDEEWNLEWEKYKKTPEWAILNRHMTVDDFKKIYMWEWSHRIIGRVIGVAFLLPAIYFVARGRVAQGSRWKQLAIALGIGFQGALGWFMVQSGLSAPENTPPAISAAHQNSTVSSSASAKSQRLDGTVSSPADGPSTSSDWHPRVSHFRLAAHLGTAFLVYVGMLHTGMAIVRDHRLATGTGNVGGLSMKIGENVTRIIGAMKDARIGRLRNVSRAMFCLTFVTAMTGALVAGLDAGLVYSELPYMGDGLAPPREELLDARYTWRDQVFLGNVTQNPVTVQFVHRCMAVTTLLSAIGLAFYTRRLSQRMLRFPAGAGTTTASMPPSVPRLANLVALAAVTQASLGISTLIYLVPIELASLHQAGSVALLTSIVALLVALRKPNASLILRAVSRLGSSSSQATVTRQATIDRALNKVVVGRV